MTMKDLVGEERMLNKVFRLKKNDQGRNRVIKPVSNRPGTKQ